MMKAAIFDMAERIVMVTEMPIPEPAPDEVLIRVCRCGICGTDVSLTGNSGASYQQGRFGHEYAGEVIEAGRDVTTHKPGDRVAVIPVVGCGHCENCRWGNPLLCGSRRSAQQGLGEYAAVPARVAVHLPQTLSFADGAMIEPMACGLHAMRLAGVDSDSRVLVIGGGSMALSAIYWARRSGARRIVVLSRSAHRADLLQQVGADAVLGFDPDNDARLKEMLGGAPHIVAECVGKPGMVNLALDHVAPRGTVISMGMCRHAEAIVPSRVAYKEAKLIFPIAYSAEEFAETARVFDAEGFHAEQIVSEVIGLEALPARLAEMRAGRSSFKIQVDPARSAQGE